MRNDQQRGKAERGADSNVDALDNAQNIGKLNQKELPRSPGFRLYTLQWLAYCISKTTIDEGIKHRYNYIKKYLEIENIKKQEGCLKNICLLLAMWTMVAHGHGLSIREERSTFVPSEMDQGPRSTA